MPILNARQLRELERAVATLRAADARKTPAQYIPHKPHPKQAEFLALTCREALFGGAAGGGKSDALLMAALQYVHVPGYTAGVFRRTFQDLALPGAIMDRAKTWLANTGARWNESKKRFIFRQAYGPPAVLQFGYLDKPNDRFRYQSTEFQFLGFDELTQFPETWYRYLFSRLRRLKGVDIPLRVRAATNPGGIGHEWVRRRFNLPAGDPSRPFVPSKIDDNPSLDADEYRTALAELDSTTRKQLEEGLWIRDTEGLVYHFDEGRNVIPMSLAKELKIGHKGLALDFGAAAPTAFSILGWVEHDPTVYVLRSWKRARLSPSEASDEVKRLDADEKFEFILGDIGGLGKGYQLEHARRNHVAIEAADKTNKKGYIAFFNGDLERGRVKIVRETCEPLITEYAELPWNEARTDEAAGFANHCADATLYGWRRCTAFLEEARKPPKTREQLIAEAEERLLEAAEAEAERAWWEP